MAAQADLTTQQWLVLLQVAGDPNVPSARDTDEAPLASDIARERALSKPTISAVVTELRNQGLVREDRDPEDGRRRRLVLTSKGARVIEKLEPLRRAANRQLLAEFSDGERRRLLEYLERCMAVLWRVHEDDRVAIARARLARTS